MPIYEYRCEDCGRKSSVLVFNYRPSEPVCEHCGGKHLTRLMSRFGLVLSEETRLERLADPSRLGDLDENDPKSMTRWMKRMGKELGEEAGEDFDQMVEEAAEEAARTAEEPGGEGSDSGLHRPGNE